MKRLLLGQLLLACSLAFGGGLTALPEAELELLDPTNCADVTRALAARVDGLGIADYQSALSDPASLRQTLWAQKIGLHERLRAFHRAKQLTPACANGIRGLLRAIRTVDDYAHDRQWRQRAAGTSFPTSAFEAGNPHVLRHPEHAQFDLKRDLKSGDVLLTRGNAYTSAAIASLGEYDTQFSHMSLVHVDARGKIWTIEAHIEVGSFVRPLQDHIDDNNMRLLVLRFEDPTIAARAAALAFDRVRRASNGRRGNIRYDFGFDMGDEGRELFCSEVVSFAYERATDNNVRVPLFMSRVDQRKPDFVRDLGITVAESFIPADIEIDPRFQIVAEWRDAARVVDTLEKDAIIHAMFAWNDEEGYRLVQGSSSTSRFYRNVVWPLRRIPLLNTFVDDRLPLNMSRAVIGYFGVLETLGELLQAELVSADTAAAQARVLPLLPLERRAVLEDLRARDAVARRPKLHKMFRPRGAKVD